MSELQIKTCELLKKKFEQEYKRNPIIEKYYGWWEEEELCKSCESKHCNKLSKITLDKAKKMIEKGRRIHTFRDVGEAGIVGSDWERKELLDTMKKYENTLQLTGENMAEMNHKICLIDEYGILFIKTS